VGLGFAVAVLCGVGGAFVGEPVVAAVGLLVALLIIGWRKLTRTVTKQSVVILNRAITILWSLLAAAGLAAALIAPLP
jgi:hypothetical protein